MVNKFVEYRREFHKYPEVGWREIRTSARIGEILTEMGYKCYMGKDAVEIDKVVSLAKPDEKEIAEVMKKAVKQGAKDKFVKMTEGIPGVVAIYDTGLKGPVSAFRFDIDALPYDEPEAENYRPFEEKYISENKGATHACGHDVHTAIGLGIAASLKENKLNLKGKIILIFQPAEETFGGAISVVEKGWLDDVDKFMAFHVALGAENKQLTSHSICCGCKDFLSVCQLDVYFHGRAAHPCGASQEGKNALLAICSATLNIHAIAPHEEGLTRVNVGEIQGGIAPNAIAPNSKMVIEYRGETPNISQYLRKRIFDILDGTAKAYDISFTYDDYGEVPAGKSDNALMEIVKKSAQKIAWFENIYFEGNVGGSDDAAVMITKVQEHGGMGTYIGIGTDTTDCVHNPKFDVDEDCIEPTIKLAMEILKEINI